MNPFLGTILAFIARALFEAVAGFICIPFYVIFGRKPLRDTPELHYVDTPFNKSCIHEVDALSSYTASPWALGPYAQTFFSMVNLGVSVQPYAREEVLMPDSVAILLDYYAAPDTPDSAPIVVTLHGIGGDSRAIRPLMVAECCVKEKWRSVLFLRRGHGDSSLIPQDMAKPVTGASSRTPGTLAHTPVSGLSASPISDDGQPTCTAATTEPGAASTNGSPGGTSSGAGGVPKKLFPMHADAEDFQEVLRHIRARFPNAPLLAVGFSMGSNVLVKYMGQSGRTGECLLDGAVSAANGYDLIEGTKHISSRKLPDKLVTAAMQKLLRNKLDEVRALTMSHGVQVDLGEVLASRNIRRFDEALMLPLYGYKDLDDYYHDNNCRPYFNDVSVPLLCLSALDDPIVHRDLVRHAVEAAATNPHIILATTHRGGHLGWLEGWSGKNWSMRVVMQYLRLVVRYKHSQGQTAVVTAAAVPAATTPAAAPAASAVDSMPSPSAPAITSGCSVAPPASMLPPSAAAPAALPEELPPAAQGQESFGVTASMAPTVVPAAAAPQTPPAAPSAMPGLHAAPGSHCAPVAS